MMQQRIVMDRMRCIMVAYLYLNYGQFVTSIRGLRAAPLRNLEVFQWYGYPKMYILEYWLF